MSLHNKKAILGRLHLGEIDTNCAQARFWNQHEGTGRSDFVAFQHFLEMNRAVTERHMITIKVQRNWSYPQMHVIHFVITVVLYGWEFFVLPSQDKNWNLWIDHYYCHYVTFIVTNSLIMWLNVLCRCLSLYQHMVNKHILCRI